LNDESFIDTRYPSLIVIDDLMRDATNSKDVCELFVEGSHHRNISVTCIMQNAFSKGKENRTMSINSQYLVLFKNPRDQVGPAIFARQMYPNNSKKFMNKYIEATKRPYGYLFIDLKQNTPEEERLKTDIFKDIGGEKSIKCNNEVTASSMVGDGISDVETDLADPYIRDNNMQSGQSVQNCRNINMDKKEENPSCIDCGLLFSTPFDVQRHIKRGCPFSEEETDHKQMKFDNTFSEESNESMDEDNEGDMDDSAFNPLIDEVYKKLDGDYQNKLDSIMNDQNVSEKEAKTEANEQFLPRERKLLMNEYRKLLTRTYALKQSPLHRTITYEIQQLMDDHGYSFEKSLSIVLRRNKHRFEELLDQDDSDDESEESDDDEDMSDDAESDNTDD